MKNILRVTLYALFIALAAAPSFAGDTADPGRNVFLGRTMGLGGAYLALSDDAEGLFLNPSGLAYIRYPKITGVSKKIFLDETAYSALSFAFPTEHGSFGFGYIGANTGGSYATTRDEAGRIVINPSLETMSYDSSVMLLSYAREVPELGPLAMGGNIKLFNQSISGGGVGNRGSAFDLDLSATYKPLRWLTVAGSLQNLLGGNIEWTGSSGSLGSRFTLGAAMKVSDPDEGEAFMMSPHRVKGVLDLGFPFTMGIGGEYMALDNIAVRGGMRQEEGGTGLTFGVGFIQQAFRFDYAYAQRPGIAEGNNPHYFSLSYIGTTLTDVERKITTAEAAVKVLSPRDRYITSAETVALSAEMKYTRVLDQKTTWTVPLFSSTSEVKEVTEQLDLEGNYIDRQATEMKGTVNMVSRPMTAFGRHIISFSGMIPPEMIPVTSEVRVLRFDPFNDTPMDHWAIDAIAMNSVLGLIKGYPDKTFKPNKGINRAELTALLIRTMDLPQETLDKGRESSKFSDIPKDHWARDYINIGAELGIVTGYPDGTFKPAQVLNRAEGVTILSRFAKLPEKEPLSPPFPDLKDGFWANKHIEAAKEAGLLNYLSGKDFGPSREFERCEAAEVLYMTAPIKARVDDFWETGMVPARTK